MNANDTFVTRHRRRRGYAPPMCRAHHARRATFPVSQTCDAPAYFELWHDNGSSPVLIGRFCAKHARAHGADIEGLAPGATRRIGGAL